MDCLKLFRKKSKKMFKWNLFDKSKPEPNSCVIYHVPPGSYVWATSEDYDNVKLAYPSVTHWKIITIPPVIFQLK